MNKITLDEVLASVPLAQPLTLPVGWFKGLPDTVSVFDSLYRWITETLSEDFRTLHSRTYAGKELMKQLLVAERKRIAKRYKLSGSVLTREVGWSNLNAGPKEIVAGRTLQGESLFVLPKENPPGEAFDQLMTEHIAKLNANLRKKRTHV